jgi:hypothetical protein
MALPLPICPELAEREPCSGTIGGVCAFLGIEGTKAFFSPSDDDPCAELPVWAKPNALQADCVVASCPRVMRTFSRGSLTDIDPPVVRWIAIFVVNQWGRVSASFHLPRQAVRSVFRAINFNYDVASRAGASRLLSSVFPVPSVTKSRGTEMMKGTLLPVEDTRGRVIAKALAQERTFGQGDYGHRIPRNRMSVVTRAASVLEHWRRFLFYVPTSAMSTI